MSRIGILRPKHVGLILLGWWSSPRLIPFHNHTQYPGVDSGNGPQMLAAGKPGLLFRHLKWAELLEDVTLRGRTGLSAFKQICDLAQSSKAPGASNFLPLYANLGSTFFPILRCLEQVKDYGEKHFPPLLFLLWTCPFTPFPLMRKPWCLSHPPGWESKTVPKPSNFCDHCGSWESYSWFWRRRYIFSI